MKKYYLPVAALLVASLVGSCGSSADAPQEDAGNAMAASKPTGAQLYNRTCVSCHQASGMGIPNVYPPLSKSDYLADKEKTILQVIRGSAGKLVVNGVEYNNTMPPQQLNDEEIAEVLTYVYSNMGNSGSPVTVEEVKMARAKP